MTDTLMRLDEADLAELAGTVGAYCRERLPDPTMNKPGARRDADRVRADWLRMSTELGIGALLVPEQFDGAGATLVEATRVAEVLAGELASVPYLSSAVFAPVLLSRVAAAGAPEQAAAARGLLADIAAGTAVVAVAFTGTDGALAADPVLDPAGATATGTFGYVLDGDVADTVILVGAGGAELAIARAADLRITPETPFDLTRGFAAISADAAPVTVLASGDGTEAFRAGLAAAQLAAAADSSGGAVAALADATDYARERIQFGRAIGGFQAIKHLLADRFVDTELALSVSRLAVEAAVDGADVAAERLALARFYCADRFVAVATDDIQVHGGMGFTAECRAHLYRRRAAANQHLFGGAAAAKAEYTAIINDGGGNR